MSHLVRSRVIPALTISVSLAVGYVFGHLDLLSSTSEDEPSAPISTSNTAHMDSDDPQQPRAQLNPAPRDNSKHNFTRQKSFDKYPEADKGSHATSTSNTDSSYSSPRRIGVYINPDDPPQHLSSEPKRIGEFADPDELYLRDSLSSQVSIGEFIDPEAYLAR